MTSSWLNAARRCAAPLAGTLLFGVAGVAQADHQGRIEVEVNTPGFYTRIATGPRGGDYYRYGGRDDGRYYGYRDTVYVPGYWTWHPPVVYRIDDRRYGYRYNDHPRHHRGDRGRHRGWDRHDHDHDDD